MRFDLTDDQEVMRITSRRFIERHAPLAALRERHDDQRGFPREWWEECLGQGWAALGMPESAGGFSLSGQKAQDLAIIVEELGRNVTPGPFITTFAILDTLAGAIPDNMLRDVLDGKLIVAWAYGEPGNSWDMSRLDTELAERNGELMVRGRKAYVESGHEADVFLVTCRSSGGLSQVLVPKDSPGLTVVPGRSIDLSRRYAEISFQDVCLPGDALVGTIDKAGQQVDRQLSIGLILQSAETNGSLERAMEFTIEYMRGRYAFGRSIASFQALKHRLADMLFKMHSCMAINDAAARSFDRGFANAGHLARAAKTYVGATSVAIMGELVQMTGGIALTWDHDLHLYERRIAVNRAFLGTPEFYRSTIHRDLFGELGTI